MFFVSSFCLYFFGHVDRTLLRRWAVPQIAIFRISYRLGQPGILLMCLYVPFSIIPRVPTITCTIEKMWNLILRCHIFSISISWSLYLLYSLPYIIICSHCHINDKACFSFKVHNIWSLAYYFSISLDWEVPENSNSFGIYYCFWLVFISIFTINYFIVFTYSLLMYYSILSRLSLYSIGVRIVVI